MIPFPIMGIAKCRSEKQDKKIANKRMRRVTKQMLRKGEEPPILKREVSNVYDFGKDGKHYLESPEERDMRK